MWPPTKMILGFIGHHGLTGLLEVANTMVKHDTRYQYVIWLVLIGIFSLMVLSYLGAQYQEPPNAHGMVGRRNTQWKASKLLPRLNAQYTKNLVFTPASQHLSHIVFDELVLDESYLRDAKHFSTLYADKIAQGYVAPVYIKWVHDQVGYGIFASAAIKKDDYLMEFTGEVVKSRKDPTWCWTYPAHGQWFKSDPTRSWINAKYYGNEARFINHGENPNVDPILLYHDGVWHIIYIANQDIGVDEQLLVTYGTSYWISKPKVLL